MHLIVWFLLIILNPAFMLFGPEHYLRAIIDVVKYENVRNVFVTHSGDKNPNSQLRYEMIMLEWTRELSHRNLPTLYVHYKDLLTTTKSVFYKQAMQPLFIILLTDVKSIIHFSYVAKRINVADSLWIVIFLRKPEVNESDYCHNPPGNIFNVKYDARMKVMCYGDSVMREWYSLHQNRTEIVDFASCNSDGRLVTYTNLSLYERRNNMRGMTLRGVMVKNSSQGMLINSRLAGFIGEILEEIGQVCNFSIKVVKHVSEYGALMDNNNWTGAIGEIVKGNADIGCAEFAMSTSRVKSVTFTLPLLMGKGYLYIKEPDMFGVQWLSYFQPFDGKVWLAILLVIIFIPFILAVVMYEKGNNITWLILDNVLYVWGVFCSQGLLEFPKKLSARLAYFSLLLSSIIISTNYSATLISFLTVRISVLPFNSLEEFAKQETYKMIIVKDTVDFNIYNQALDPMGKKIKSLMLEREALPLTVRDGFLQICKNPQLAFYSRDTLTYYEYRHAPCKVVGIHTGRIDNLGIIMSKHNPFTMLINTYIQKFYTSGILHRFKPKDIDERGDNDLQRIMQRPIDFWNILPLLAILIIGLIFGTITLYMEKTYECYKYENAKTEEIVKKLHCVTFERNFIDRKVFKEIFKKESKNIHK